MLAKFGESAAAVPLATIVLLRVGKGGRAGTPVGMVKLFRLMGVIGTVGLWRHNDIFWLSACTSGKKYGHHMILIWCPTNSRSLYTMVPSD